MALKLRMTSVPIASVAMARLKPSSQVRQGCLLTLTYQVCSGATPNYNVMGMAKASLVSWCTLLSIKFGCRGIRVNAISAGPIRTLAASGLNHSGKRLT